MQLIYEPMNVREATRLIQTFNRFINKLKRKNGKSKEWDCWRKSAAATFFPPFPFCHSISPACTEPNDNNGADARRVRCTRTNDCKNLPIIANHHRPSVNCSARLVHRNGQMRTIYTLMRQNVLECRKYTERLAWAVLSISQIHFSSFLSVPNLNAMTIRHFESNTWTLSYGNCFRCRVKC